MAEYVLREDENQEKVVQELLANADHPDHVTWQPRSGVPHGGVYVIDDGLAERMLEHRRAVRDAEAQRIEDAQEAAEARDSSDGVAEGLVTPAEAGFAANVGSDPGAPGDADGDGDEDLDDEDERDDQADEAADEAAKDEAADANATPASRKRGRRAATKATPAAEAPATAEPALANTEGKK